MTASGRAAAVHRPPRTGLVALALVVVTWLVFAGAGSHEFVNYDDPDYVTDNSHVRAGLSGENVGWALTAHVASNWHPLTWMSHMIDVSLFGQNPQGHHATSVLLHGLNAGLAFWALLRLTGAVWRSAGVAAVFALHPLRAESVAWIAERKDVLSGLFFFLCLWAYARYAEQRRHGQPAWRWYGLAVGSLALGLMAKPMLVTVPCLLLLLDVWPLRRTSGNGNTRPSEDWPRLVAEKIPFLLLAVGSSIVTYIVQRDSGAVTDALSRSARLANAVVSIPRYVGKLVWPSGLAALYPHPGHWSIFVVVLALLFLGGLTVLVIQQRAARPWLAVGWLWFVGMLVPVSGVVQVGLQSMADRYTYLPAVGFALAGVWCLAEWLGPARQAWGALLAAFALLTVAQVRVWRNSVTLFHHTVAVAGEGNYLAYDNLGIALGHAGDPEGAIASYRRALEIRADYPNANNNLARALAERGRLPEALELYRRALRVKPEQIEIHNNFANALSDAGAIDEAIEHYQFVLAREPGHVNARNGYAVALAMKDRLPEAEAAFRQVLCEDPANVTAFSNLGNVCALLGRRDEAALLYQRAMAAQPNDPRTPYNLANVLVELGRTAEAIGQYQRAVALAPVNPDAHAAWGHALARLGRRDEALQHLRLALQQQPGHPQATAWLAALTGTAPP